MTSFQEKLAQMYLHNKAKNWARFVFCNLLNIRTPGKILQGTDGWLYPDQLNKSLGASACKALLLKTPQVIFVTVKLESIGLDAL